jgi:phytoene desaturase
VESALLEPEHRSYSQRYWESRVVAPTMFIIYLGLSKKLRSVTHHNLYFSRPWDDHFDAIFVRPRWPEKPSYYVSCASYDDPAVAPEGHENVFFLVPVAPGLEDSDELRERYAEKVLDHFESLTGETIRDSILIRRLYSHRDFSGDYNAFRGTALGLSHTLSQTAVFRPSQRSKKVKNLYYCGQYTHPGVGVPMALISAQVIGDTIVQDHG